MEEHSSKLIQHLGIIAGVCKEVRLAKLIDQHVDIEETQRWEEILPIHLRPEEIQALSP